MTREKKNVLLILRPVSWWATIQKRSVKIILTAEDYTRYNSVVDLAFCFCQ